MDVKIDNPIIIADIAQKKEILWKKYLAKKKSFAKAQFQLNEFCRLDEHAFECWLNSFASDKTVEAFILKHEHHKKSNFHSKLKELCRMRKTQMGEMIFQIQKICIDQNRFFWGVVSNLYEQAHEDMQNRYRQALKDFLDASKANRDTDPETIKTMFETFQSFCHTGKMNSNSDNKLAIDDNDENIAEVKKLYRALCFKHHPDKTGIYNEELWHKIQQAYELGNVKKLKELLKLPVMKNMDSELGLTCNDILAMTLELEQRFKLIRASWKRAKRSMCWDFRNWNDDKKEKAKTSLLYSMDKEITTIKNHLQQLQTEINNAITEESITTKRKRKNVKIQIEVDKKSYKYKIHFSYFRHTKDIEETAQAKISDNEFAEVCVISALKKLKEPCRVTFFLPDWIREQYKEVEFAAIFGGDISNLFTRHIVTINNP